MVPTGCQEKWGKVIWSNIWQNNLVKHLKRQDNHNDFLKHVPGIFRNISVHVPKSLIGEMWQENPTNLVAPSKCQFLKTTPDHIDSKQRQIDLEATRFQHTFVHSKKLHVLHHQNHMNANINCKILLQRWSGCTPLPPPSDRLALQSSTHISVFSGQHSDVLKQNVVWCYITLDIHCLVHFGPMWLWMP